MAAKGSGPAGTAGDFINAESQRSKDAEDLEKRENVVSKLIVDAAVEVHRSLGGPGLLESVYEEALVWELRDRGLSIERQLEVPISYKGRMLSSPLKLDVLVEKLVIVEVKATVLYNRIFEAQVLTYLRLMQLKLGLVINFGEAKVGRAIHRVVNGL